MKRRKDEKRKDEQPPTPPRRITGNGALAEIDFPSAAFQLRGCFNSLPAKDNSSVVPYRRRTTLALVSQRLRAQSTHKKTLRIGHARTTHKKHWGKCVS
jgi:hypothetical protein